MSGVSPQGVKIRPKVDRAEEVTARLREAKGINAKAAIAGWSCWVVGGKKNKK